MISNPIAHPNFPKWFFLFCGFCRCSMSRAYSRIQNIPPCSIRFIPEPRINFSSPQFVYDYSGD